MNLFDLIGLVGVVLMLIAYGLTIAGRLEAQAWPALTANFAGAAMVLLSLSHDFNLSAAVIESVWALIALAGLARLGWRSVRSRTGSDSPGRR